jgi:hypothetical protein
MASRRSGQSKTPAASTSTRTSPGKNANTLLDEEPENMSFNLAGSIGGNEVFEAKQVDDGDLNSRSTGSSEEDDNTAGEFEEESEKKSEEDLSQGFPPIFLQIFIQICLEGDIWTQLKNVTNKAGVVLKEAAAAREKKRRLMSLSLNVTGGNDFSSCEDQPKSKSRKIFPKEKGSRGRRPRKINEEEASTKKRDLTEFFDYVHPYSSLTFTLTLFFSLRLHNRNLMKTDA